MQLIAYTLKFCVTKLAINNFRSKGTENKGKNFNYINYKKTM